MSAGRRKLADVSEESYALVMQGAAINATKALLTERQRSQTLQQKLDKLEVRHSAMIHGISKGYEIKSA